MPKAALITGVAGQDGSYLTELLLDQGYEVHGLDHDSLKIDQLKKHLAQRSGGSRLYLHVANAADGSTLVDLLRTVRPTEIYNLAAQSQVEESFVEPISVATVAGLGVVQLLEAVRSQDFHARIYQASTSEIFGCSAVPQLEETSIHPVSPYGCAKAYAHHMISVYRSAYEMFACAGILFNHESPRRTTGFVSRKVTLGIARILAGQIRYIRLGNMAARRDWGHAKDYVRAMWLMLQRDTPADYVIATGISRSVAEFVDFAFSSVGLDWRNHVVTDPTLERPTDPSEYRGDATKARHELGWEPVITFEEMVREMLIHDLSEHGLDFRQFSADN
jgi:GDPmannose 4,6-dehydratase